jgi:hypothetical protein
MGQLELFNNEVEEISQEDLEAAAEKFDDIKANPTKYFTSPTDRNKAIWSLEKAAKSLEKKAESINTEVSGNWTNRRQRFADSAAKKKDKLILWSKMLIRLAELWRANDVPTILLKIRNASDIDFVLYNSYPNPPDDDTPIGGWYREEYPKRLKKALSLGMRNKDESQVMKKELENLVIVKLTPEEEKTKLLQEKLKEVHTYNIPGFFPTPDDLIDKMLEFADIQEEDHILEPEAGIGNIPDRIRLKGFTNPITCIELSPSLHEILELKGYNAFCRDAIERGFMDNTQFEKIIMNPPFEKGQDIDHVMFCFETYLKPGGRLVAIMSSGSLTGSTKKHLEFNEFRFNNDASFINNGQAFKNAFNSTGISSIILVVEKQWEKNS